MSTHRIARRTLLAGALLSPLAVTLARAASDHSARGEGNVLVVYLTRTGNTRVIASTLHRALGGELFEIRAAIPYPEDYEETVERARQERDSSIEPKLASGVANISVYDTIFLGFPIWGETAPPPVRSFLRTHDLADKQIYPFITHGGYGIGNSMAVLRSHAPNAHIDDPFVMEADQERRTINQVRGWIGSIGA